MLISHRVCHVDGLRITCVEVIVDRIVGIEREASVWVDREPRHTASRVCESRGGVVINVSRSELTGVDTVTFSHILLRVKSRDRCVVHTSDGDHEAR